MGERFGVYEVLDEQGNWGWWVFDDRFSVYVGKYADKATARFEADKLNYLDSMGKAEK